MIVVDEAVAKSHFAVMNNQGQVCCAGTRTFVQEEIYDAFVEKSKALAEKRVSGSPLDLTTENGPQVRK